MEREISNGCPLEHERGQDDAPEREGAPFATAYQSYMKRLLSLARSILGCDEQACDAVQEAFIALWKEPSLPPNPWAWLVRAVVFRSRHARRCRLRRRRHEDRAAERRPTAFDDRPDRELENEELRRKLEAAIEALPAEFREAFVLSEVEGLDYRAVAGRVAAPIGTVRSRIHRARARLQELLEPESPAACA